MYYIYITVMLNKISERFERYLVAAVKINVSIIQICKYQVSCILRRNVPTRRLNKY